MLLAVERLSVSFPAGTALREASLSIEPGERIAIVGESGSGKSMLGSALMGMAPAGAKVTGSIRLRDKEMADASPRMWRRTRGRDIAMIFQEPMAALDPLRRIGDTITEPLTVRDGLDRRAARRRALGLLEEVGIPEPEARLAQYPHELSGGQRQRVLIALALSGDPAILIADEPTTALDAKVAQRIIDLLTDLSRRRGMALLLISHDLGAVARATERMIVMYGGDMVEAGATAELIARPRHPYTQGLLAARPRIDPDRPRRQRLATIPGTVPPLDGLAQGCRFSGRCPVELARCGVIRPWRMQMAQGHVAACHALALALPGEEPAATGQRRQEPVS